MTWLWIAYGICAVVWLVSVGAALRDEEITSTTLGNIILGAVLSPVLVPLLAGWWLRDRLDPKETK